MRFLAPLLALAALATAAPAPGKGYPPPGPFLAVDLYPLPNFKGPADRRYVPLNKDTWFGPQSNNKVGSIKVLKKGYVCLLFGSYINGECVEGIDELGSARLGGG